LVLALVYRYSSLLDDLKSGSIDLISPFYWVSDLPSQAGEWADNRLMSRERLVQENASLRSENLVLKQKIQKNASLEAENFRLRQLLNATESLEDRVLIAELIGVTPDPQVQRVILNKGSDHNVYVGQAVLDAFGLMGQVIEVGKRNSVVLLITDTTHAIPVEIGRSGLRLVADGIGDLYALKLRHVASTLDIEVGDSLVSSGLGGRFPRGYPVAEVTEVKLSNEARFSTVFAKPYAQMNISRHVLLVFETEKVE
jgi:rod shape-determining protein MreC